MPKTTCSIDGCENKTYGHGWCNKHYRRWYKNGDPTATSYERFSTPEGAFKAKTEWSGDCLVWTGSKDPNGYGQIQVSGRLISPHRYAWERENGPIPSGIMVNHMCWNPSCVNVEHLELSTNAQNSSYRSGPGPRNRSGVRNVKQVGDRWSVRVKKDYKLHYFGTYDTIDEAAEVAERARRELFGHFAGRG